MLRDFVVALSLANVFFVKWWIKLLDVEFPYHARDWPFHTHYPGMMLNVLGIGFACGAAVTLARRARSPRPLQVARLVFLIVVFLGLPFQILRVPDLTIMQLSLRDMLNLSEGVGRNLPIIVYALWPGVVAILIARWTRPLTTILTILLIIVSPVLLVSLWRSTSLWLDPHVPLGDTPKGTFLVTQTPRVVWVVFDEFDKRIGFDDRPEDVRMPAFDRLRDESVSASHAYPPGSATMLSLPALITGRFVAKAKEVRPDELRLVFGDADGHAQETAGWSTTSSIFTRVRELGGDSALVGVYHPYCRILGSQLADCFAVPYSDLVSRESSIWGAMVLQLRRLTRNYPFFYRYEASEMRAEHGKNHGLMLERARQQIRDSRFDLLFFHFLVPHLQGIYDRKARAITDSVDANYLDNLELADRVVAVLREELEDAGMWEETTLIVTSDHSFRTLHWREKMTWTKEEERFIGSKRDHRVPLFVKFPSQTSGYQLVDPINGIVLHNLVLAVASGEVGDAAAGIEWLEEASGLGLSPYH